MLNFYTLIIVCFLHRCPSTIAIHDTNNINILSENFSLNFDRDVIRNISSGICRQESQAIRFIVDDNSVPLTAKNILQEINTNCHSAPVEVMFSSVFRYRSEIQYPFEMCVFVFVLSDWRQFRRELFNRRLEAKGLQRYFFVIEGVVLEQNLEWLYEMMAELWEKQILNVVVIFSKGGDRLHWFTYTPFAMENMQISLVEMSSSSDWFFNKLRDVGGNTFVVTMNGDPVRAVPKKNSETRGFTGVDGNLSDLIRERMNATFVYVQSKHVFNGSIFSGMLSDLRSGRANFAFNAETYVPEFHEGVVEVSNSFERNDICILVPSSTPEPMLYNLWHTLTPLTWGIIITTLTVMMTAYRWIQSLEIYLVGNERHNYNVPNILSIHFQSFFGDTISSLPTSSALRILIVCWCLYSFLINTAFTAKLISSLVLPRHVPDIDKLEDLGKSPLNIMYPDSVNRTLFRFLGDDDDKSLLALLRDQMSPVPMELYFALTSLDRKNNAYIMPHFAARYIRKKNFDTTTSRSYYHLMQECLMYSPKIYLIEQGSACLERINELLGRFHEMGFIVKWERDANYRNPLDGTIVAISDNEVDDENHQLGDGEEPQVVITVAHLQTAFYLLGFGLMLSGIALAGEIWWMSREHKEFEVYDG